MITNNKYILASSSASRKQILNKVGLSFKQVKPTCNEEWLKKIIKKKNKSPIFIAKKLSYEKARSISQNKKYSSLEVIGCDTIISLNNQMFDKAKNMKQAKTKIKKLSGKKHKIISGLTICKNGKKIWQCSSITEVKIRNLSEKQIDNYLKKTGTKILQSVGCYQIESLGPNIIEGISGDFFNVMGLPLFKLLNYVSNE